MKCPNCGGEVPKATYICVQCGKRFTPGKRCTYCSAVIPNQADVCPKCGRPQQNAAQQEYRQPSQPPPFQPQNKRKKWVPFVIAGAALALVSGLFGAAINDAQKAPSVTPAASRASSETMASIPERNEDLVLSHNNVDAFLAAPEEYKGRDIEFTGEVVADPIRQEASILFRINVKAGITDDQFNVFYPGTSLAIQAGDLVKVKGRITSSKRVDDETYGDINVIYLTANSVEMIAEASTESSASSNDKESYINQDIDMAEYTFIPDALLYEYGEYFAGEKVGTVITVEDKDNSLLKAKTPNNDSFFYSINCEFNTDGLTSAFEEGDILAVVGTVDEKPMVGSTVTLRDCAIVGIGKGEYDFSNSKEICEQQKVKFQEAQQEQRRTALNDYKANCITVDYMDVERNPDSYKGTQISIAGTVEQVQEGWFDTVVLRVNCGGNMWYVTYAREEGESRILEGDYITCYGECDGVESYTTVLGSQVTIPSLKMEYYE